MKESVQIANDTYAKYNLFLHRAHLHVNVPEGATPKDGPNAGSTFVSAYLSL